MAHVNISIPVPYIRLVGMMGDTVLIKAASDFLMGTPKMLWFASEKMMFKIKIPKPEVGNGHPLAVGLLSSQHGLKADVKAEVRSTSPEGLGLDICFGHAIVFKGKKA